MRRLIALVIAVMLAALPALSIQAPAATHAARSFNVTFTGRLVAAPRTTDLAQPVNLLLQMGPRTILVQVTSSTQIVDRYNMPIALSALRDRAQLQISGRYTRLMLVASRIRNLSYIFSIPLQVKGQLGALPVAGSNLLCLANASVAATATPQIRVQTTASCPAGQLPIILTGATGIRNAAGAAASLGDLRVGDNLAIAARYNGFQIFGQTIKDTSLQPSLVLQLAGQLGALPVAGSNLLCLANANVVGAATPQIRAQTTASCPAGQLPIVLTGATMIRNAADAAASLGDLRVGDNLTVTGSYNGVQIFGQTIKDTSLQPSLAVQVTGQLAALPVAGSNLLCLANASVVGVATPQIRAQTTASCLAGQLPIALTGSTGIRNATDAAASLGDLRAGDSLTITGSYNGVQITATAIKDASLQASQVVLTGRLVATPQSTNLAQPLSLLLQVDARTVLVQVSAQTQLIDRLSNTITLANLQNRAMLQVTGNYNGVVFVATQIQDQSLPAPAVQAKGQLVAAASAGATVVCLANSVVTGASVPQAQAQTVSACPAGQLPVYLAANTQYFSSTGVAIPVTSLRMGDLLQVSGVLDVDQFTASVIVDVSL